jgi:hypothetical protein
VTSDEKGSIAEAAIVAAAIKLRVPVLKPINDGRRYDLVFELGNRFLRVQCKWAPRRGNCILVGSCSCRRGRDGFIRSMYSPNEVDVVAAYCPDIDQCFAIPIARIDGHPSMTLRLSPTRNNQRKGVNWARDFDFTATLQRLAGP